MELGRRIAYRLRELGLTQVELARKSGLTQQVISQYIRGKSKPGYDAVLALIRALEVDSDWFFEGEGSTESFEAPDLPLPRRRGRKPASSAFFEKAPELPSTMEAARDSVLVIGHWLPLQDFPSPTQVRSHGVIMDLYSLIFNQLTLRTAPRQIRGALAVDWKPIGKSWVFQLRDGVRFHRGKALKAEDVMWSYERYLQGAQEQQIEGIEVIDNSFVQIHLKTPCRLEELAMPFIVPFGAREPITDFVGTGPFMVSELTPGLWRLQKNPHYFLGRPYFSEIQVRQYADAHALERALKQGEVHFAIGVYASGDDHIAKAEPSGSRYQLHFMLDQPLSKDAIFRQAIALALDRKALAKAIGLKEPLYSTGPFDYMLGDRSYAPPPYSPEAAAQLLKSSPTLRDAVFRVQYQKSVPQNRALAEAIVEQLNRIGLASEIGEPAHARVTIRPIDRLENEYNMWATGSPYNLNGYSNPAVDALIQQLQDTGVTSQQLLELRQLIQRDLPDIPLFYHETPITYIRQLRALEDREISLSTFSSVHAWYLDESIKLEAKVQESS